MIHLVYIFLIWNTVVGHFTPTYHTAMSGPLAYVDEAIVLVLLAHLIWAGSMERRFVKTVITIPVLALLGTALVSMLINGGSVLRAIQFIFSLVKPFIVFTWIVTFVQDDRVERFMLRFVVVVIAAQVPFVAAGLLLHGREYIGDFAVGALNDSNLVATFMWLGTLAGLVTLASRKSGALLIALAAMLAILALTSSRIIVVLLPVAAVVVVVRFGGERTRAMLATGAAGLVFLGLLVLTFERQWSDVEFAGAVNFDETSFVTLVEGSEKIQGYYSALVELPEEIPTRWLGAGPGEYGSYTAMFARTPLAEKYIMYYDDIVSQTGTGVLFYRSSGIIALLGDLGYIGLIVYGLIYFRVSRALFQRRRQSIEEKVLAALGMGAVLLLWWESIVLNVFEGNVFILNFFWILAGGIVAGDRRRPMPSDLVTPGQTQTGAEAE